MKVAPHILAAYAEYERTTHAGWRSLTPYANELEIAKDAANCIPALLKLITSQQAELESLTDEANALAETEFYAQRELQYKVAALERELATLKAPAPTPPASLQ